MLLLFQVCVSVYMCKAVWKVFVFCSYLPWFEFFYWALEKISEFKSDLSAVCGYSVFVYVLM